MMLISWPTLMNRPCSSTIASRARRALRRWAAVVSASIRSGLRKRRCSASQAYDTTIWNVVA